MLEVYLQVWRTAQSYDQSRGKVLSWLVSLTHSRAIDALRSRQARRAHVEQSLDEIFDPQDPRSGPERLSAQASQTFIIQKFMAELPTISGTRSNWLISLD